MQTKPPSGLGEAWRAMGRLRTTGDTKHVFEIMRALGSDKPPKGYGRLLGTAQGGRIAYRRVELVERFGDAAWLEGFAPGTVGAAYRDFIARNNISAAGLAEDSRRAAVGEPEFQHPYAWYGRRNRDIHDVWHVLTGYGTDGLGEGCVVAFSFAQTGSLGFAFIAWHVARMGKQSRPDLPFYRAVWRAWRAGRKAAWLPGEDYEALFAEPLEAARARLGIEPPDTYRRILVAVQQAANDQADPLAAAA